MSRTNRAEWAKRVERWRDSGLTAKEFAAETGLKASTLSYWKWRLGSQPKRSRRGAPAPGGMRAGFVELERAPAVAAAPAALELLLAAGVVVRIPRGFDEETLSRVVRAVGTAR